MGHRPRVRRGRACRGSPQHGQGDRAAARKCSREGVLLQAALAAICVKGDYLGAKSGAAPSGAGPLARGEGRPFERGLEILAGQAVAHEDRDRGGHYAAPDAALADALDQRGGLPRSGHREHAGMPPGRVGADRQVFGCRRATVIAYRAGARAGVVLARSIFCVCSQCHAWSLDTRRPSASPGAIAPPPTVRNAGAMLPRGARPVTGRAAGRPPDPPYPGTGTHATYRSCSRHPRPALTPGLRCSPTPVPAPPGASPATWPVLDRGPDLRVPGRSRAGAAPWIDQVGTATCPGDAARREG